MFYVCIFFVIERNNNYFSWREAFLPALAQKFGWELSGNGLQRQYQLEIVEEPTNVFTGEYGRIGAFERQRPYKFVNFVDLFLI